MITKQLEKQTRRRILNASEFSGTHVGTAYAPFLNFYYRPTFSVLISDLI